MASILIVAPYATWTPNWETDLEIAQRSLDQGDRVTIMVCRRQLSICDPNPNHCRMGCVRCVARQLRGLSLLSGRVNIEPIPSDSAELYADMMMPATSAELVRIRVDNFDIGWSVLSSLVSWHADPEPNLNDSVVAERVRMTLSESSRVYHGMRSRLSGGEFQLVYVFNGRLAITRAVVRACEAEGIAYRTHERGCDHDHYQLYENRLPHELAGIMSDIRDLWAAAKDPDRAKIACSYYVDSRAGISRSWLPYTGKQTTGYLPVPWQGDKKNVAVFLSSEDEFVAIGEEWCNPIYDSQLDGLRQIVAGLCDSQEYVVYIRMHPNQIGNRSANLDAIRGLKSDHIHVIEPDSPVSSYALLDAADKILSFGSTMGIEAAYWGKPSIVAGRSAFAGLGSTYEPDTHAAVIDLLLDNELRPLPRLGALKYGYYESIRGERFKYYQGLGVWDGLFKGKRVTPGWYRALTRLQRVLSSGLP